MNKNKISLTILETKVPYVLHDVDASDTIFNSNQLGRILSFCMRFNRSTLNSVCFTGYFISPFYKRFMTTITNNKSSLHVSTEKLVWKYPIVQCFPLGMWCFTMIT